MDIYNLIGGVIGGALSGTAVASIAVFIVKTLKDRWIVSVKAEYDKELEQVRDSLQREQKKLQSKLDHTTYVTEAQYDLELSSYKELWLVMSELRERWREVFGLYDFGAQIKARIGDERFTAKVKQTDADLSAAYDNAILVSERLAPFYEKSILKEARATTLCSQQLSLSIDQGQRRHRSKRCGAAWNRSSCTSRRSTI